MLTVKVTWPDNLKRTFKGGTMQEVAAQMAAEFPTGLRGVKVEATQTTTVDPTALAYAVGAALLKG